MVKRWKLADDEVPAVALAKLAAACDIPVLLARILWHRGLHDAAAVQSFLHPEEYETAAPLVMKDMPQAVQRVAQAIEGKENIVVYGDYDADGMTATTLLVRNIRELGGHVSYYIPVRAREGYGFNRAALHRIADEGADLLISVDCGIASVQDVAELREYAPGIDVVITDHHLPGAELPPALAVVDPHREDCPYPDKDLAGVGVALKLARALWQRLRPEQAAARDDAASIELATIGTVADIVPLLGENRTIVKAGLELIAQRPIPGIAALLEVADIRTDRSLNAGTIGFQLAPRLNAAGRLADARLGVEMLLADDMNQARVKAKQLDALNRERQDMEQQMAELAERKLTEQGDPRQLPAIVTAGAGWNPGVIGLTASFFQEKYYRPSIVFTILPDGTYKGSCRSIPGLHMYEALEACSEHIIQFGGHAMAAGLTVAGDEYEAFKQSFEDYVAATLSPEDFIPGINIEAEVNPQRLSLELVEKLNLLEPFGMGNPKPLLGWRAVKGHDAISIGKNRNHLKFRLGQNKQQLDALWWSHAELAGVVNNEEVDIVYAPSINEYAGRRNLQCMIEDIAPAASEQQPPSDETLRAVYRYLYGIQQREGRVPFTRAELAVGYSRQWGHISLYTLSLALDVFSELGLLNERQDREGRNEFFLPKPSQKQNLHDSPTYRSMRGKNDE